MFTSPPASRTETAALLFTAGTTGQPKAVPLTHNSFTSFMLSSVEPPDPDAEERMLLTLPLYHVAGLQSALAGVYGGRTIVIQRQFEPREWLALVQNERVQRALVVPTMLKQLIDHPGFGDYDLSSLEVLTYGGASMPPVVLERAIAALPHVHLINAFGQTETGSTIAMVPPEDHVLEGAPEVVALRRKHLTSIGRPLPDVEVRVVDEQGRELPVGETGELAARGPRLMRGYWQADAEALSGGWLRLGDLGYIDEDGYIYLQGRAKDFIKRGGEMVSPEEVENVLYLHIGVDECAVVGVPDETWGERVVAVVVAKPDAAPTEDALLDLATERLARFKRPEQVVFVDALPAQRPRQGAQARVTRATVSGIAVRQAASGSGSAATSCLEGANWGRAPESSQSMPPRAHSYAHPAVMTKMKTATAPNAAQPSALTRVAHGNRNTTSTSKSTKSRA